MVCTIIVIYNWKERVGLYKIRHQVIHARFTTKYTRLKFYSVKKSKALVEQAALCCKLKQ